MGHQQVGHSTVSFFSGGMLVNFFFFQSQGINSEEEVVCHKLPLSYRDEVRGGDSVLNRNPG